MIKVTEGGVTAPKGFTAGSCAAGIKKEGIDDMAMLVSAVPCRTAGTYTSNRVKAAPVLWDREITEAGRLSRAVVVNAGVANAATGRTGLLYCRRTAAAAAKALGVPEDAVLVASTGVIGRQLPIERMEKAMPLLAASLGEGREAARRAARAIMTTDTVPKECAVTVTFSDGTEAVIGGMCKGSGMIHPDMCTMLSFIATDADISQRLLQKALSSVVPDTFNMVSVDGDTSTNDTCLVMANGLAGNGTISEEDSDDFRVFREGLFCVAETLAKKMAKDGEGATCLFACRVVHAASKEDAKRLARSVVSSTLTKAAVAGHDANWGRILCALGYSGAEFDPERVDLRIESAGGSVQIATDGVDTGYSEEEATKVLKADEILALVDVKAGDFEAEAWGCDLTHDYVSINADYRS